MYEDPEFKDSFMSSVMSAITESHETGIAKRANESQTHASAYVSGEVDRSEDYHAARGDAFLSILEIFASLTDTKFEIEPSEVPNQIRRVIGQLASEVYFLAQTRAPQQLLDGAVGVYYPGFGNVVHWERARGLTEHFDQLDELMKRRQQEE
jgi:hypothetical protein